MKNVQNRPGSLATTGSTQTETKVDDQVFNMLLGVEENWDSLTNS